MGMMRRKTLWVAMAVTMMIVAVSLPIAWKFGSRWLDRAHRGSIDATAIEGADLTGSGAGTLVSAMTMPGFTHSSVGDDMQSARVVYRSTSGDTGALTVVSGAVFTPLGSAPEGSWPVIALAHGTTGLDEPCAPSLYDSLLGFSTVVAGFVKMGYAVALPDYQGLGSSGVHPYTDARTAGLNTIDSVRALRRTFKNVSNRWAAVGGSQGGGASWAADEQAAAYAPDLELVGAVAYSPAADISGVVDKAQAHTLTDDQRLAYLGILESLARLHQDLNRDDFRHGAAAKYWDILASCSGPKVADRGAAAQELQPGDLAPATPAKANRLRELLKAWALPQRPLSAPLSVVYGGQDPYIDAQWTTDAITRACALGGTVVWQFRPDKGHDVDLESQLSWIADRFAGKPVTNACL
jgi:pimeloyl-ACP methyl ester carboxylesterase